MKQLLLSVFATKALLLSALLCSPAFALNGNCSFEVRGPLQLNFGVLDPSVGGNVTSPVIATTVGADQVGDCKVNLTVTATGPLQLTNGAGGTIPYSLATFSASAPGNNKYTQLLMQGTILGTSYQNAPAGAYSQSITVTVSP